MNVSTIQEVLDNTPKLQEALINAFDILHAVKGDREVFAHELDQFELHPLLKQVVAAMPAERFNEALEEVDRFAEALVDLGELGDELEEDEVDNLIRSHNLIAEFEDILFELAEVE